MNRRLTSVLSALLALGLATGCTDRVAPTAPVVASPQAPVRSISDGARGGDPIFLWLRPTVAVQPQITAPFDAGALDQLVVEVCQLDANAKCDGPLVERMTSTGTSVPERIQLDARKRVLHRELDDGPSHVDPDLFYRVRVLRNGRSSASSTSRW